MKMMNVSDEELLNDKQQTSKSMKSTTNYNVNSSTTSQKRPMNAFLIFCKRHRSVVKQKYPHLENRSITKILGEWWAKISHQDKQKYTELARQYKEAFLKANPGFKWYKSDIKIDMQSCSPPSYVSSFTNNTTTINNTNASLNCNLFNNGNYQSDNDNTQKQSNGSNMTNQSDLNSHISTNKNDKLINNNDKPIDKTNNNFAMTNTSNNSSTNNLTPKPPKKRYLDYLENGKEPATQTSTNSTNINSNLLATTSSIKNNNDCKTTVSTTVKATTINETNDNNLHGSKNYAVCGGPPVLDIETMNRVIENAFGPAEESNTITTNKKSFCKTSTNNKKTDSHSNLFSSTNRKNQLNKDNTKQQDLSSSNKTSTTDSELKLNADLRCNEKFNDSNEQFDKTIDKESRSNSPINSAIVDKFINANNSPSASCLDKDKLNNKNKLNNKQNNSKFNDNDNESNDKPLNLSSTTTVKKSQQVLIDNLIEKFLSNAGEGNPMPIEMLQNSTSYTSSSSKQNAQRKQERSCKGKRYLEMLNENQMRTKRNKSASNSSICNNGDELNNKNQTSSKWVSGNFDLEEKIRDFEEINFDLEEHDLKNVLDSSNAKTNSDKNETSSSFSTLSQVANDQPNNILLNNNEHNKKNLTSSSSSSSSNIKIENNKTNTFTDKQSTENLNENRKLDSQLSNSSADLAEKIVERLNLNSQTLECNGLVALAAAAEAASSSCT